ncbi:hypothetical protein [Streptomyces bambusae]|uniref:Lipoprotein n=1 Tax=Streptomyces bambusae TaxID=1550616 RepID=A0ABS6Z0K1_9ACTN|nr:hypothetical protein [Streptomyces bambusae]MBW5481259.1 hypothetical protein [Streptomyces bambusae]
MRNRNRACGAMCAALVSALLLTSCSTGAPGSATRESTYPRWEEGAGATEAAAFMKVQIPEGATDVKGAVQVNPREDEYILSFRTDRATATRVAEDLHSEEPLKPWRISSTSEPELFGHLGLTEPQTLKGALWAGVCPPCVKDYRRRSVAWLEIHIENLEADQARVYLRAF